MVTLDERMKRLELFLDSIPEEFRTPAAPVDKKPKEKVGKETASSTAVAQETTSSQNDAQKPSYDGPPFTALDIRIGYIKNAYEHNMKACRST